MFFFINCTKTLKLELVIATGPLVDKVRPGDPVPPPPPVLPTPRQLLVKRVDGRCRVPTFSRRHHHAGTGRSRRGRCYDAPLQTAFRQGQKSPPMHCKQQPSSGDRRQRRRKSLTAPRRAQRFVEAQEEIRQQYEAMPLDVLEQQAFTKHRAMRAVANKRKTIRPGNLLARHLNTKVRQYQRQGRYTPTRRHCLRREAATQPMRPMQPSGQRRFVPPATPCATPMRYTRRAHH